MYNFHQTGWKKMKSYKKTYPIIREQTCIQNDETHIQKDGNKKHKLPKRLQMCLDMNWSNTSSY